MIYLPFPSAYKKTLLNKSKNITLRFGNEKNKYQAGKIYEAASYSGTKWNIKSKITQVTPTTINNLSSLGIPKRSIAALLNQKFHGKKITSETQVDLIKFEIF